MNMTVIEQFRSGAAMRMPKAAMLLLTARGRRTGTPHTSPMMFVRVRDDAGEHVLVAGSNSGAPRDPDWVANLRENPDVIVELGDAAAGSAPIHARATVADEANRALWWPLAAAANPMWAKYQASVDREIPLVELQW